LRRLFPPFAAIALFLDRELQFYAGRDRWTPQLLLGDRGMQVTITSDACTSARYFQDINKLARDTKAEPGLYTASCKIRFRAHPHVEDKHRITSLPTGKRRNNANLLSRACERW
jgi:hypothetical protein